MARTEAVREPVRAGDEPWAPPSHGADADVRRRRVLAGLCLLPFVVLWWVTIDQLRVEWDLNPQYSYGWLMPILCAGLLMRRWKAVRDCGGLPDQLGTGMGVPAALGMGFVLLAALYLPTRLIQEATPEWRMVSWALGISTVGLTLIGIAFGWGMGWLRQAAFPILFFLVAIPWPSFLEGRLIQGLTRGNTAAVIEVLTVIGIPAVQHGNLIEVGTGTVGVEEACSGIRSFQSSLMISLFLGEFFRVGMWRRVALVPLGFVVAFGFNICRTTLLTHVAATKGVDAIAEYHDPAGFAILLACSAVLWAVAWVVHRSEAKAANANGIARGDAETRRRRTDDVGGASAAVSASPLGLLSALSSRGGLWALRRYSVGLLVWLVFVEAGVWLWYRSRESGMTVGPMWSVVFPKENPTYEDIPMHPKTAALLRFDEGQQGRWEDSDGTPWMGFYFDWRPGRVAGYLAKRHTPEACLPASGATLRAGPELMPLQIHGIDLPMRHYVFESQGQVLQVFQCRWEAGAAVGAHVRHDSESFNLVRGIWAGRGKHGQKVLEFILSGPLDDEQAKAALVQQLEKLIRVDK